MPELDEGFAGSGEISSAGPLAALVNELMVPPPPDPITDLRALVEAGLLTLDWSEVNPAFEELMSEVTYDVYRAQDAPYFLPSAGTAPYAADLTSPPFPDPDATVLTDGAHSTYYLVKSVYEDQASEISNRVAAFNFTLQPGVGPYP